MTSERAVCHSSVQVTMRSVLATLPSVSLSLSLSQVSLCLLSPLPAFVSWLLQHPWYPPTLPRSHVMPWLGLQSNKMRNIHVKRLSWVPHIWFRKSKKQSKTSWNVLIRQYLVLFSYDFPFLSCNFVKVTLYTASLLWNQQFSARGTNW